MCNIMFRVVKYDSLLYSENIPLSIQPHKIILSPIKFHVHIYIYRTQVFLSKKQWRSGKTRCFVARSLELMHWRRYAGGVYYTTFSTFGVPKRAA